VLTRRSDGASAVREIDIEGILGGQVAQTDAPSLSDGDVLFVPQAVQRLTVLGEVARPGVYPVERGATLMDVMAAAGGPTEKADMGAVRVYDGGNAAEAQTLELADDRLIFEGSIKSNPPARRARWLWFRPWLSVCWPLGMLCGRGRSSFAGGRRSSM
jgi:hypothetical protein